MDVGGTKWGGEDVLVDSIFAFLLIISLLGSSEELVSSNSLFILAI